MKTIPVAVMDYEEFNYLVHKHTPVKEYNALLHLRRDTDYLYADEWWMKPLTEAKALEIEHEWETAPAKDFDETDFCRWLRFKGILKCDAVVVRVWA